MVQLKRQNGQNYADNIIDELLTFEPPQTWSVPGGTGTAATDSNLAYQGTKSLKIENTDPKNDITVTNSVQSTVIPIGGTFQFSMYLYKDDANIPYSGSMNIFKNAVLYSTQDFVLGGDGSDELENADYNQEWVRFVSDVDLVFAKNDIFTVTITLDGIPTYLGASTTMYVDGMMLNLNDRLNAMPPLYQRPVTLKSEAFGIYDYNDSTTSVTPIAVSPSTWTPLTNDGAGAFTNKVYALRDVSDVFDTSSGLFDFSGLELGDKIEIRFNGIITTSGANQTFKLRIKAAIGTGSEYEVPFVASNEFKTAGDHETPSTGFITMLNTDTLNNGARFEIFSDASADFEVVGWQCIVNKRLV